MQIEKIKFNQEFYGGVFRFETDDNVGFLTYPAAYEYIQDWCQKNCNGWFSISGLGDRITHLEVVFEEKTDFVAFKLKWM